MAAAATLTAGEHVKGHLFSLWDYGAWVSTHPSPPANHFIPRCLVHTVTYVPQGCFGQFLLDIYLYCSREEDQKKTD
jgi:hypothetical protein